MCRHRMNWKLLSSIWRWFNCNDAVGDGDISVIMRGCLRLNIILIKPVCLYSRRTDAAVGGTLVRLCNGNKGILSESGDISASFCCCFMHCNVIKVKYMCIALHTKCPAGWTWQLTRTGRIRIFSFFSWNAGFAAGVLAVINAAVLVFSEPEALVFD